MHCSSWLFGTEIVDGRPLNEVPRDAADMWEKIIAKHIERELPLPARAAERTQILRRVTLDLCGDLPTPEEITAFVADNSSTARDALVRRLVHRPGIAPFMGTLPSGETRFRVLPVDPDAAKRPRTANNPGHYTLRKGAVLAVSRGGDGAASTPRIKQASSSLPPIEASPCPPVRTS